MTRIIIHQPQNFESKYYRYHNVFFDNLIAKLKNTYEVIDSRYFKYANSKYFPLLLLSQDTYYDNTNITALDCEMVIENYDTKQIKILSMADDLTSAILNLQDSKFLDIVLVAQYNHNKIKHHLYDSTNIKKYSPWIYFPQTYLDYDSYYNYRQSMLNQLIDKFYFRGSSLSYRSIISHFDKRYFSGGSTIGPFEIYAKDLLQYKIGYSIAGRGEFCYRDIEYMAMGIPFMRFEYTNEMNPPLIPNFHYISVPRIDDLPENLYGESHAKLIENKFLEVKNNQDFLNFISDNARKYYLNFIHDQNGIDHTIDLLQFNSWT